MPTYGNFDKVVSSTGGWGGGTTDRGNWWWRGTLHNDAGSAINLTGYVGTMYITNVLELGTSDLPNDPWPTDGTPTLFLDGTRQALTAWDKVLMSFPVTITAGTGVIEVYVPIASMPTTYPTGSVLDLNFITSGYTYFTYDTVVPTTSMVTSS